LPELKAGGKPLDLSFKHSIMSLLNNNNNKKNAKAAGKASKPQNKGSQFMTGGGGNMSKPAGPAKKVRSTGANRGS
jgi:hypothetical protein